MKFLTKYLREIRRLLSERLTLLFMAVTVATAVWFCLHSVGETATDAYILEAAKNSAMTGALIFTLLTLLQFHRDFKNHTDCIVLTCTDSVSHQLRRTLALICAAIVTTLAVTAFALPFAIAKTGAYFQGDSFVVSWYLIFWGSLVFSVLLSSGLYMLTQRIEVSFAAMAALILISKLLEYQYDLRPSYLFFWVQTNAGGFSDLVSNQFQIDMILWNRLFCMLAAIGVWFLGLCCFRRYGCGVLGSLCANCRRIWPPMLLLAAVILTGLTYSAEPIFDNSVPAKVHVESSNIIVTSHEVGNPDLILTGKQVEADIDTESRTLSGKAVYTLQNTTDRTQTLPLLINSGYTINTVLVDGNPSKAVRDSKEEGGAATWRISLPAAAEYVVELRYSGRPQNDGSLTQRALFGISSEYIWLLTTAFSPSTDTAIADDCHFYGILSLDERLEPFFTNVKAEKGRTINGKTQWQFSGGPGTSSTGLTAAGYATKEFEAGGITVQLKYFIARDKVKETTDEINVIKAAIEYFTKVYGALPYKDNLTILELPASFAGGFALGNISAMDETCFAVAGYLPDEADNPHSGGGADVLVHEIAHQWWGTSTYPIQDDTSDWSAEGITCYSTYCFMAQYFGNEYAEEHFLKKWKINYETYNNAFCIQNPEYLKKLSNSDAATVIASLNSIRLYDIMSLRLLKAEAASGGRGPFQDKLKELYESHLGDPVTYEDFLSITGLNKEALNLA